MLTNQETCRHLSVALTFSLLSCCLVGCQTGPSVATDRPDEMVTVGGIFWPDVTLGFETEASTKPMLAIPRDSVCDIRVHPGAGSGRAMVKVLVNGQWHVAWVDQIPSHDHEGMRFMPFDTFPYLSCGSEQTPDRNWNRTQRRLIEAADAHRAELSDETLRALFGEKTFGAYHAKS